MKKLALFIASIFFVTTLVGAFSFNFAPHFDANSLKTIKPLRLNIGQLTPFVNLNEEQVTRVACFGNGCGYNVNFMFTPHASNIRSATLKTFNAQGQPAQILYVNGQFLSEMPLNVNSNVQNSIEQAVLVQQTPNVRLSNQQILATHTWNVEICTENGQCVLAQQNRPIN